MKRLGAAVLCLALLIVSCGCTPAPEAFLAADAQERARAAVCGWDANGDFFQGGVADAEKLTGMFYFTWLGQHPDEQSEVYDITQLLQKDAAAVWDPNSTVSPLNEYHFWGEPLYGYYNSADPWVIRRHIEMFVNAGIDFLGLDATNAVLYESVYKNLFSVLAEFREQGFAYPRICFLTNSSSRSTVLRLYELYYADADYDWLWLYRDGKPFIVLNKADFDFQDPQLLAIIDRFSYRHVQWPYFEPYDEGFPWMSYDYPQYNHNGIMSVSVAQHTAGAMSRSGNRGRGYDYESGQNDAAKISSCSNYCAQWQTAQETEGVEMVFLTGWNEWMALKLPDSGEREVCFTDAFNYEFSRDIEPSARADGDAYYLATVRENQKFQTDGAGVPALEPAALWVESDLAALFRENKVMTYPDLRGDTAPRDYAGAVESLHYTENTGRHDIVSVNLSNDRKNLYILVECAEEIGHIEGENCLNVQIRTEGSAYVLNRAGEGLLTGPDGIQTCETNVYKNRFWAKIPLEALKDHGGMLAVRVTDNVSEGLLSTYVQGDSAPLGNLYYQYRLA